VTVAIGFGAALLTIFGIVAAYEIYNGQKFDAAKDALATTREGLASRIDSNGARIDTLALDVRKLSIQVDALPGSISREVIAVARDISVTGTPPPR
jgi:hypothetical protein